MLKQWTEEELFRRPLSELQKAEVLALLGRPDDAEIDTSDIPEISELPAGFVRGKFYRGGTVHLSEDLRRYFVDLSRRKGVPLNDLVNETLSKAIAVAEVAR